MRPAPLDDTDEFDEFVDYPLLIEITNTGEQRTVTHPRWLPIDEGWVVMEMKYGT